MQRKVDDVREQILAAVDDQTSADEPWTSTRAIVQGVDVDTDRVKDEIQRAANANELLEWRGKVAPVDRERLVAIIEAEKDADATRKKLIGRANRMMKEVSSDGE